MNYTYRRSLKAMAVTSSTTSAAFLANLVSPLLPIKSFGIFAGVIVLINYLLVIIFMPAIITIYEKDLICNNL